MGRCINLSQYHIANLIPGEIMGCKALEKFLVTIIKMYQNVKKLRMPERYEVS